MISVRTSKSLPTKMTGTIHKGHPPLCGVTCFWQGPSLRRSRILTRMRLFCMAGLLLASTAAQARSGQTSPHDLTTRPSTPAALAHELEQRDSATATLQQHCLLPITAHLLDRHASAPLQQDALRALLALPTEQLEIRHVQLLCGKEVWSEAWNLYLPDRLTSDARHRLASGHIPFGKAIGERNFIRQRLNSHFAGLPLGIGLENRAILRRRTDKQGFSYLIERYTTAAFEVRKMQATNSNAGHHQEPASGP